MELQQDIIGKYTVQLLMGPNKTYTVSQRNSFRSYHMLLGDVYARRYIYRSMLFKFLFQVILLLLDSLYTCQKSKSTCG